MFSSIPSVSHRNTLFRMVRLISAEAEKRSAAAVARAESINWLSWGMRQGSLVLILFALVVTATPLAAAEMKKNSQPRIASPNQAVSQKKNSLSQSLEKMGVRTCLGRIDQVTNFLLPGGAKFTGSLIVPPGDPNRQLFSTSIGVQMSEGKPAYIGASFAPDQSNNCAAVYEAVVYWPFQCADVARKSYAKFKKTTNKSPGFDMLDGGPLVKVFLLPAGQGCVSIKKEIVK